MRRSMIALILLVLSIFFYESARSEEARLLRFPDIRGDKICFSHGGDLWLVSSAGGAARKLTNSEGLELFPKFSPDGSMIAFTGEYEGDLNVYVMPTKGGEPKRLSYRPGYQDVAERHGPENIVMGWTPDGSHILYRSRAETHDLWDGKLYLVSPNGGMPQPLPLPRGGFASFNADRTQIAYCPIFRDFRTWKRYKGGMAQDVWIYDFVAKKSEKITDWEGTDNLPMWHHASGKIYFNSDRTGTLNLFVYDPATKTTNQVTQFTEFDVRWPSLGGDKIIFENGGYLYVFDLPDGQPRKITVELNSDNILARPKWEKVKDRVQDWDISPDAKRAVFSARGDIFTVPAEHGETRNLTQSSGANDKNPSFSPDGKWIVYVSDASGEDELYIVEPGGNGVRTRLTQDGDRFTYQPIWSPDSKNLLWTDKSGRLVLLNVASKAKSIIDESESGFIGSYNWSPDSKWITYSMNNDQNISVVFLYSLGDKKIRPVTDGAFDDYGAAFDPEGKYLYFISDRAFNPMFGNYEFNYVVEKTSEIMAIVLTADGKSPLEPRSDEVEAKSDGTGDKEKKKDDKKDKDESEKSEAKPVKIDFDNIMDRQVKLPVDPGSYGGLWARKGEVYFMSSPLRGVRGALEDAKRTLHVYNLESRKTHEWLVDIGNYAWTYDGEKMLVRKNGNFEIINTGGEKAKTGDTQLNLNDMEMLVDYRAEWEQIFEEVWRRERDFFYDPNMHGVDWQAMHDRYAPLVDHVAHRFDLTYVLGEMISELSCSHTYVGGGEMPNPASDRVGLLGINWAIDSTVGKFRIGRILNGENWRDGRVSPLREPGIKAKDGDYILAINDEPLTISEHPFRHLEHKAGDVVKLTLSDTPDGKNSWDINVEALSSETGLRYADWVEHNYHYVDSASNGRIGYVHIPDMGGGGLIQFTSTWFAQIRKEGMVIDVRYNGGGFVSQLILERLRRIVAGMTTSRNSERIGTYPSAAFHGYMACMINEHACSDGDIFPYFFREYGLGPLIGKTTWGGVVGIRGVRSLLDGGFIYAPEFSRYDWNQDWVMENRGVQPDIDVDNLPEDVLAGRDPQLDRAIEYILHKIETEPMTLPGRPAPPGKK